MAAFTTEGIVLKQFDLGEADKIITFFTRDQGKLRAVAKGVRKSKSPISGLVLPFSYNQINIYRGRSLDRINQIKNIYPFSPLREDLLKMAYASFMAELVERVGMENDPNQPLFSLLLSSFHQLLKLEQGISFIDLFFKIKVLNIIGFKPQLAKCVLCAKPVTTSSQNYFNIKQGGIICASCSSRENDYTQITGEAAEILKSLFNSGFGSFKNLRISAAAENQLNHLIDNFILYHLDLKLKSLEFLNMIKKMG